MDVGTMLSVVETFFAALKSEEVKEVCSILGYKSQVEDLEKTVKTVEAVLRDAENKVEPSNQEQLLIEELKDAVYDADDLLDEFVTLVQRKHKKLIESGKSKKFLSFFSRIKELPIAYRISKVVKDIRKKLDGIADNHNKFTVTRDHSRPIQQREETCDYVCQSDIIGRDADKEKIVGMLLDSNVQQDVSFFTIVGMGGLGKTALTQLVYNDKRIQTAFPTRVWACIGDENPNHLDVGLALCKIVGKPTNKLGEYTRNQLKDEIIKKLAEKFLLVLDDVWNENRDDWRELEKFLKEGKRGSWVVVTTRSESTAEIIGNGLFHRLEGLSAEDSWFLFKKIAFKSNLRSDVEEIARDIVKKCANVPLCIKVVGSLLYEQPEKEWRLFQQNNLVDVRPNKNNISGILMHSYHRLEFHLKSCFKYCALFPKDFVLEKQKLIQLWMAQGYLVPSLDGESEEDVGEQYFTILLRRCFFQDVGKDEEGKIRSCKIHDLMHDIAQQVAANEIRHISCVGDVPMVRHISCVGDVPMGVTLKNNKVRTFVCGELSQSFPMDPLFERWRSLRVFSLSGLDGDCTYVIDIEEIPESIGKLLHLRYLDLSGSDELVKLPRSIGKLHNLQSLNLSSCRNIKEIPESIGELLHLRYLNLSWSEELVELPRSIGKLHNLQILNLRFCSLKELPNELCKLVRLRVLDIRYCYELSYMPLKMGMLSSLHTLTDFKVDVGNSGHDESLKDLKALRGLKGKLRVEIRKSPKGRYVKGKGDCGEGGYLLDKQYLNKVVFHFDRRDLGWDEDEDVDYEEALMEDMQPHPDLKHFELECYNGGRMPNWGREDNLSKYLPKLVTIFIEACGGVQCLASIGNLKFLRELRISWCKNLEYVEEEEDRYGRSREVGGGQRLTQQLLPFFPSLQKLVLNKLPKLKGWWRREVENEAADTATSTQQPPLSHLVLPSFPRLSELTIRNCPELTCIPLCPNLEKIYLRGDINGRLKIMEEEEEMKGEPHTITSMPFSSSSSKLREVTTRDAGILISGGMMPIHAFQHLTKLTIWEDNKLSGLDEIGEVFRSCSSSLKYLKINNCTELRSVGGLQHLTALESLQIRDAPKLSRPLPEWLHNLPSLHTLQLDDDNLLHSTRYMKEIGESNLNKSQSEATKVEGQQDTHEEYAG